MKKRRGFTLLELMIVVVVMAILASLALSGYNKQVRKSRRAEAKQYLSDLALRQEKWRSNNVAYFGTDSDATEIAAFGAVGDGTNYYTIAITSVEHGTDYVATATPIGDQVEDSCGTLTWNMTGGTVDKDPDDCW